MPTRSSGLIAHWPLADNLATAAVVDVSRNGLTGTLNDATGTATTTFHSVAGPTGQANTAFSLDGTDDFILFADAPEYNWTTKLCAGAWIYKNDLTGTETVISKYLASVQGEWIFGANIQKLRVIFGNPADGTFLGTWQSSADVITATDTWYHVAFTYDAGTVQLYVNGVAVAGGVAAGSIPATPYNGTADVIVGAYNAGAADIFAGRISDPFISRVPTYTTVRRMYRAGGGL